ncbi:PE family protein [Mycobacterium sp.]|uniref:PE family protein n=1 Tax=Mycobacterium sp. TaxID=1785 RepID=UPI003A89824B
MSFVVVRPDLVMAATEQLAGVNSLLNEVATAAAGPTTGIAAAAGDEISAAVARLFGTFGQEFQAINAQASAFSAEFARLLNGGAAAYANAELANAGSALLGGLGGAGAAGGVLAAAPGDALLGLPGGLLGGGLLGGGLLGGGGGGGGGGPLGPVLGGAGPLGPLLGGAGPLGPLGPVLGRLGNALGIPLFAGFPSESEPTTAPYQNPYVTLVENSSRNFDTLRADYRPFPVLNQVVINQNHYAQQAMQAIAYNLGGFPGNVSTNLDLFMALANSASPGPVVDQFVGGITGLGSVVQHQLILVGEGLQQTYPAFRADLDSAWMEIQQGNYGQAVEYGAKSFIDLFISGFDTSGLEVTPDIHVLPPPIDVSLNIAGPIGLEGPAGALMPILTALGQNAQGGASFFPPGGWPGGTMRNLANGIGVLTDTTVAADFTVDLLNLDTNPLNPSLGVATLSGEAFFGMPLQLGFAFLGSPFAALGGWAHGGTVFGDALLQGDLWGAANALGNMPAFILDGFLNGEVIVQEPLPVTVDLPVLGVPFTMPTIAGLPMAGLLVPPHNISATVPLSEVVGVPGLPDLVVPLGGTKFGGLLPFLLNTMPQTIAPEMSYLNSE